MAMWQLTIDPVPVYSTFPVWILINKIMQDVFSHHCNLSSWNYHLMKRLYSQLTQILSLVEIRGGPTSTPFLTGKKTDRKYVFSILISVIHCCDLWVMEMSVSNWQCRKILFCSNNDSISLLFFIYYLMFATVFCWKKTWNKKAFRCMYLWKNIAVQKFCSVNWRVTFDGGTWKLLNKVRLIGAQRMVAKARQRNTFSINCSTISQTK